MAFTSFSPNDERFGFRTKGSFNVPYENERVIIIWSIIILGVIFVSEIVLFFAAYNMLLTPGNVETAVSREYQSIFAFDLLAYGTASIAMAALLCLGGLGIIAFCIILGVLKTGKTYGFTATEKYFEIIPPDETKPSMVFNYDDTLFIYADERKFLFGIGGYDITIKTKQGSYLVRYIHTPESRKMGFSETPFNIIQERIGLKGKPRFDI